MAGKMMTKDLLLESTRNRRGKIQTILPNIPGQRYVIGSTYPGEKEGEEFIFCRPRHRIHNYPNGGPTGAVSCVISVDEKGQYWIGDCTTFSDQDQSDAKATFETSVNSEKVKGVEQSLLKSGDIVSLGGPETPGTACRSRHIFHVTERIIPNPGLQSDENLTEVLSDPNSPLVNDLILEEIMSYLPVRDLKNARLISKKWKAEASKYLEKRGAVSFEFKDYENSDNSTSVFRYLHEMRDLKVQKLHIFINSYISRHSRYAHYGGEVAPLISPGESGEKLMDDLRKLLKSPHNFSTLFLQCENLSQSAFGPLFLLFEELGGKLVELKLALNSSSFPAVLPPLPVMTNLKKFTHSGYSTDGKKWISQFVPLLPNSLEHFTCSNNAELYLKKLLKRGTPNLKKIAISGRHGHCRFSLPLLLELKNPLTFLEVCSNSQGACCLLERLLWKHSKSLQHLQIRIGHICGYDEVERMEVKFPSFPNLKELGLSYLNGARVSWDTDLNYKEHFSSLRKLTVLRDSLWDSRDQDDDPVFHAFFPEEGDVRCETVKDLKLWIPLPRHLLENMCEYEAIEVALTEYLQQRKDRIKGMFPNADKADFS